MDQIRRDLDEVQPDLVVVTGDAVVPRYVPLLGQVLADLFGDQIPVIATLGNHEFGGKKFEATLNDLRVQQPSFPNVHFLDIKGGFQFQGVNFVGGACSSTAPYEFGRISRSLRGKAGTILSSKISRAVIPNSISTISI